MKKVLFIFIILFLSSVVSAGTTKWKQLTNGLEYASVRVSPGIIHALRIDPKQYKFGIVTAKELGKKNATAESLAKKFNALIAINGGFFTPEYDSLGLLINDGKVLNPLKNTSWWSVFLIKNDIPRIVHTRSYKKSSAISMAVQSGPRLVVNGTIPKKLKPSIAERSALCIDNKKNVIIVATENLLIQPDELAEHLRKSNSEGGFGCRYALNLDGGSSTQLYAKTGSFELNVPGTKKVANAIVVYKKSK